MATERRPGESALNEFLTKEFGIEGFELDWQVSQSYDMVANAILLALNTRLLQNKQYDASALLTQFWVEMEPC